MSAFCAERWLVASNAAENSKAFFVLKQALSASAAPMSQWRQTRGLLQVLPRGELLVALQVALKSKAARVHVYADFEDADLNNLIAAANHSHPPGRRLARVLHRRWSADSVDELVMRLAQPDAPVELAWQHGDRTKVPELHAEPGQDPALVEDHQRAFLAWRDSPYGQASAQVADELNEALEEAEALLAESGYQEPEDDIETDQPDADTGEEAGAGRPDLPVYGNTQVAKPSPGLLRGRVAASGVRAAGAGTGPGGGHEAWTTLHTWKSEKVKSAKPYELQLLGDHATHPAKLRIKLLMRDVPRWTACRNLQVWLFPKLMRPLQVSVDAPLSDWAVNGVTTVEAGLPINRKDVKETVEALKQGSATVYSE